MKVWFSRLAVGLILGSAEAGGREYPDPDASLE